MFLGKVDVAGFRGINRLSLMLEQDTVLIGENAWGKSSLLDVLTLILAPDGKLYAFTPGDFYVPAQTESAGGHRLRVILTFREYRAAKVIHRRYQALAPAWDASPDGYRRVNYCVQGILHADGTVTTQRGFLSASGEPLALSDSDIDALARHLIRLKPVLRLRDARFMRRLSQKSMLTAPSAQINERQLALLFRRLDAPEPDLTDGRLQQGLEAMVQLLEHYFSEQSMTEAQPRASIHGRHGDGRSWRYLDLINRTLDKTHGRGRQLLLLAIFASLLQRRGATPLSAQARPLLLVEDPETRLHPIMLSVAWHLLNQLPLQKITTTNSGELLSLTPVGGVCRLVRGPDRVTAWRLGPQGMSAEDSRRISFHIRFNRPTSLFARCWLLVEGETEVWVINELARQCGYHFDAEGVKVIEFAQCGLRPLVKFAQRMGIEWHVLTDGDEAGKKYAATARSLAGTQSEHARLTQLPARDMEHFMYRQGFADVYHRVAQIPQNAKITMRRVIVKAIHRTSKPDLALEVAMEAGRRGVEAIPAQLRHMFLRVTKLARERAD